MKGVILRKGERAYSYFSGVLSAIFPAVVERNWLITGYENYPEALEPYGGNLGSGIDIKYNLTDRFILL